jgi:hypothetical protein
MHSYRKPQSHPAHRRQERSCHAIANPDVVRGSYFQLKKNAETHKY